MSATVLSGASAGAQASREADADTATLHQWLHGDDPRLVAWAATEARERKDAALLAEISPVLEQEVLPPLYTDDWHSSQAKVVSALLDALIQTSTPASARAIRMVNSRFPAQAALLASRLPEDQALPLLRVWLSDTDGGWAGAELQRVAAMLLAREPKSSGGQMYASSDGATRSFVGRVVEDSEEAVQVRVSVDGSPSQLLGHGSCGDFVGGPLEEGWPQVYIYDLVENDKNDPGVALVELGTDSIRARRFEENRPWGSCFGVQPLNAETRYSLLAYWVNADPKALTWRPEVHKGIRWTDEPTYESELGALVEGERRKLEATVRVLHDRGLLNDEEAEHLRPRLTVSILCDMKPCPLRDAAGTE
ncbi:hypothetical protein [Silvibacterium sp.]|uniref:hypothetical protein n=1 Tax=Silvibacterium sp. TaxID=1964179 RepID=UPI0039E387BC